jgi:hypothetical protein
VSPSAAANGSSKGDIKSVTSPLSVLGLASPTHEGLLSKELLLLKQQHELLLKGDLLPPPPPPPLQTSPSSSPSLPHFVCEGCGIKFKSVSNLQAHQARYCAGLRKAEEIHAFEAMLKRSQQQPQPFSLALSAAEMMSFLNAKSLEQQAKAMSSSVAAEDKSSSSSSSSSSDFCCILCGYKEQSVERLKDHINMHFIGQVKKPQQRSSTPTDVVNGRTSSSSSSASSSSPAASPTEGSKRSESSPPKKKFKQEVATTPEEDPLRTATPNKAPASPNGGVDGKESLRCDSCDIGFTHLSNFMAHKKYYCRGLVASHGGTSNEAGAVPVTNVEAK